MNKKKKKPKFGVVVHRKKKVPTSPKTKKALKKESEKPTYGPNVFVALHDADGNVSVNYWDAESKSIKDVVERIPAVLKGTANISVTACQEIIKLLGKTVEAAVSFAQGGYGPANAVEDVTLRIDKISVQSKVDGESSEIDFTFTIVP